MRKEYSIFQLGSLLYFFDLLMIGFSLFWGKQQPFFPFFLFLAFLLIFYELGIILFVLILDLLATFFKIDIKDKTVFGALSLAILGWLWKCFLPISFDNYAGKNIAIYLLLTIPSILLICFVLVARNKRK